MNTPKPRLIYPYGGKLTNLLATPEERAQLLKKAESLPWLNLSTRGELDLELLATGAFSPLSTFVGKKDYQSIVENMRLSNGTFFPIPITLNSFDKFRIGQEICLKSRGGETLALLEIEEIFEPDLKLEFLQVLGTLDSKHPLVGESKNWGKYYLSGKMKVLNLPKHYGFPHLRLTPQQVRKKLIELGSDIVVAFQTRNPIHRAHEELTKLAAKKINGSLLIHPVVGLTKEGDIDYLTRVRSYLTLFENYYDKNKSLLSLLPLAMRFAGPREALLHAIVRRNYGASHFIIGRSHASPGLDSNGKTFYEPYAAQELLLQHSKDIGITTVPFKELVYLPEKKIYKEFHLTSEGERTLTLSGTQVREDYLNSDRKLPDWFTRPEVAEILNNSFTPMNKRGFCIWFTGLPCAGKTTIAELVAELLMESGRNITFLDGDVVRTNLSKGLGFSKEDRDANIFRIGFVAAEVVKHNGIAICAAVSPYEKTRNQVRDLLEPNKFILVFIDTPLSICKRRDVKGHYSKAKKGEIKNFTGVSDPYERPKNAEIIIKTNKKPLQNAMEIINYLKKQKLIL